MKPQDASPSKDEGGIKQMDKRINETLKSMQGLLSGRSFPGKIRLTRKPAEATKVAAADVNGSPPSRAGAVSPKDGEEASQSSSSISRGNSADIERDDQAQASSRSPSATSSAEPSSSGAPAASPPRPMGGRENDSARVAKFKRELAAPAVNLDALRELAWSGVPPDMRPTVWRLLLGYAPPNADRREAVLARKRQEYMDCVPQYYDVPNEDRSDDEIHTLRQISVDVPRTVPDVPFFQQTAIQTALERVLYIWAIRHPASGYVQGINDLVTPFLTIFLSEVFADAGSDMAAWGVSKLPQATMLRVEADCYWCLSKLLDGIQDHYTFAQPGIQRLVFKLKEIVRRIDEPVSKHIEEQGLEFLQFAFRWFNCLLIREIPFLLVARLWDTYLAEGDSFSEFLVYACASFMLTWSEQLQGLDFQEMVMFLQHLPTRRWTHQELEMVLSRAFMWRVMFDRSPHHLMSS